MFVCFFRLFYQKSASLWGWNRPFDSCPCHFPIDVALKTSSAHGEFDNQIYGWAGLTAPPDLMAATFLHASLLGKTLENRCPSAQVVVLSQVLAHESTVGYEHLNNLVLTKLNGVGVSSLAQVVRLLRDNREPWVRFDLDPHTQHDLRCQPKPNATSSRKNCITTLSELKSPLRQADCNPSW